MPRSWSQNFPKLVQEPPEPEASEPEASAREPQAVPPVEQSEYLAGEVIGDRYRLVRELGRGGMGVVWVAHSLVLGVDVALKLIRSSVTGGAVASRMAREAHAAARLGHPALVRVFDFGWTSRGDPFLVMELVQGETLSARLDREARIAAIGAVQMLLPIADGLRVAHDKAIVHRDIKPDNIFLATDALGRVQPKLLDFGIAKVGPANYDGRLTQVGVVLGSPEYMSPEQALGVEDIDQRTDVWSLSVVLYEMLTGIIPFRESNYNALMHSIINEDPKPTTDLGAGDDALWLVVQRGLAKPREQRWGDMTELGEALALWLYEHGIKEDLSGNSIRAVWLDGVGSGLRADVPASGYPRAERPTVRPNRSSSASAVPVDRARTTRRRQHKLVGSVARKNQRRPLAIALAIGAGLGGLVVTLVLALRAPSPEPRSASSVVPSAATPAAGFAGPGAAEIETAPPASAAVVASGSSRSAPSSSTRSNGEPVLAAKPASRAGGTSSQAGARPSTRSSRSTTRSGRPIRDFGF